MDTEMIRARLAGCQKLLIGLGEEWKWKRGDERRRRGCGRLMQICMSW